MYLIIIINILFCVLKIDGPQSFRKLFFSLQKLNKATLDSIKRKKGINKICKHFFPFFFLRNFILCLFLRFMASRVALLNF